MKKYLPILLSFLLLIISIIFWDSIKLPYNENNVIVGEYFHKKFNPLNDKIRFLLFIIPSVLIYLSFYLKTNTNTLSLNLKSKEYFLSKLNKKENYYDNSLNLYSYLFILLITLEFFSLDFNQFIYPITGSGIYHSGTYLVPPLNYLKKGELLQSTMHSYGLVGNNLGLFSNFILGYYTIGSISFIKLILVYFNQFLIILISRKIISYLNLEDSLKKLLFIVFTFFLIFSIPHYYGGSRTSLYLFFILLLGSALCDNSYLKFKIFLVGIFSILSVLWWFDIGFYINILIILTAIYLIFHGENKKLLILIISIFLSWAIFLLIIPPDQIKEFFYQLNFIYSTSDYSLGIEYIKPFSASSGRWTKALIVIYMTCLMLIHLNFSKKFILDYRVKIFISLIFFAGIILFNDALMRSDSYHVKSSSGLYTFVFLLLVLIFLFQRIEINKKVKKLIYKLKLINFNIIIFIFFSFILSSSIENSLFSKGSYHQNNLLEKIRNILYVKNNIQELVQAEDNLFLENNVLALLKRYEELSKTDNCIQILSSDVALPYFLKKPSCTQFITPGSQIFNGITENRFIDQLDKSSPNIILFKSPNIISLKPLNMPLTLKYIEEKYSFYENYNGYIFYKKK